MVEVKKQAYVHQLYQAKGQDEAWGRLNWASLFEKLESLPGDERVVRDVLLDPVRIGDALLLGMLRPHSADYLATVDSTGKVVDLLSDKEDEGASSGANFFHTSVALLLPVGDAFAIAHGTASSPRAPFVAHAAEEFHARLEEHHWTHRALLDRGKLQQLKDGAGVERFSTSVDTNRTLFDPDETAGSLATALNSVGDALGADVQIDITISLPGSENSKTARERFRDKIVGGLDRLIPPRSAKKGATAKVYSQDGYATELELVEHRMQVAFEVGPAKSEKARYTALMQELAAASEDIIEATTASI